MIFLLEGVPRVNPCLPVGESIDRERLETGAMLGELASVDGQPHAAPALPPFRTRA